MNLLKALVLSFPLIAFAQIEGRWLTGKKTGEIEIVKRDGKYFGTIVAGKEREGTGGLDVNNPDKELRKRKTLGLEILKDMKHDKNEWNGGTIYDPDSGKTYKCMITQKNPDELNLRGYIGISLFGRTDTWTRIKPPAAEASEAPTEVPGGTPAP